MLGLWLAGVLSTEYVCSSLILPFQVEAGARPDRMKQNKRKEGSGGGKCNMVSSPFSGWSHWRGRTFEPFSLPMWNELNTRTSNGLLFWPFHSPFYGKGHQLNNLPKPFAIKSALSLHYDGFASKWVHAIHSFPPFPITTWPVDFGSCAGIKGGSQLSHWVFPLEWQWRHHSTVLKKKAGLARTDQIHSRHQAHLALCLSQNLSNEDHLCCACAKMLFVQGKRLLYSTSRSGPTLEK